MKNSFLTIILIVFTFACAGSRHRIVFNMSLEQIERPQNAKNQYGMINTTTVDSVGKRYLLFEDDLIKTMFFFGDKQISLILENKSDHTIKLHWNNAAWISPTGESGGIVHSGVKLIDKDSHQKPSVIVRKGKLTDVIIPSDHIYYRNEWRYLSLFYDTNALASDMQKELQKAQIYVGKTCGLLLPIEIEGILNDYLFTFKIGDAQIVKKY